MLRRHRAHPAHKRLSVLCATTLPSPADGENPPWSLAVSQAANPDQNYRTGFPWNSPSSTISRCLRRDPRRATALERRILSLCERIVFANARLSTRPAGATVVPMHGDVSVRETGATHMLSRTIDVDGWKVFSREGGAPGRGTSTSRSTASQHSRMGIQPCSQ